ncbi:hypothetical protein ACVLV4_000990 [Rathayibacter agropyri]
MSTLRQARGANIDLFLLADRVHFDDPLLLRADDIERAREYEVLLPEKWRRGSNREWNTAFPPAWVGPAQGWKIHVAAIPSTARPVLKAVVEHCVAHDIGFKYLRSELVLLVCGAKYASRSSSGKFMTIYPRDETELFATLDALEERIGGLPAPIILNDVRWKEGPLHVRYGGFIERWCEDEEGRRVHAIESPDGVLVPDQRRPFVVIPDWVEVPARLRLAEEGAADLATCDYSFEKALHFSNAGGVYRGRRRSDGLPVVLKEARPYAGLDGFGVDAVERLKREYHAHGALVGLDGVPALIDCFQLGGHTFLVSAYVETDSLQHWVATHHPGVRSGFLEDRKAAKAYAAQALKILRSLADFVAALHESGWAHGDLHPGNVLLGPDGRLSIVDFELAAEIGKGGPVGLGCPGFARPDRGQAEPIGPDDDRYALGALALWLFLPIAIVLSFDSSLAHQHATWAQDTFNLPEEWRVLVEQSYGPFNTSSERAHLTAPSLVRSIRRSASPERSDRLFPGDVLQYLENGVQFAAGAAGVIWSLAQLGEEVPEAWVEWLTRGAESIEEPGLLSGQAGAAVTLRALGRGENTTALLEWAVERLSSSVDSTLYSGRAGVGLALIGAGGLDEACRLAEGILKARVASAATSTGVAAGLVDGWSGVAVFLTALAEATGEERYLDKAHECIRRDLLVCAEGPDGALLVEERGILYPYLAHGSAGIAVASARLARAGRTVLSERQIDGLVRALSPTIVIEPGVFDGRAGLMLALDQLGRCQMADTRALVDAHVEALDWHGVAYGDGLAVLGRGLSRVSMDYATGAAGIAAVLSSIVTGRAAFPFLDVRPIQRS